MTLHLKLKKALCLTLTTTTLLTALPMVTFASDYTGHWAENTINEWKAHGIINGYEDGSFKPKQAVTRAEFAKMVAQVFGLTYTEGVAQLEDVVADKWYTAPIQAVVAAGLMSPTEDGHFRPNEATTREEAAYALAAAYHITGTSDMPYKDQSEISEWARSAVAALTANSYMTGYPEDGTFRPQGSLTRAEAVTLLDHMTADIIQDTGTYTEDIQGNVVINTADVVLKDKTIHGNLYLAEGISEGTITLDHIQVTGEIIIEGGAKVKLIDTTLADVYINKAVGTVNVIADAGSEIENVVVDSAAQLQGKISDLAITTQDAVQLVDAEVETITVTAEGAKVDLDSDSVVATMVIDATAEVSGKGIINAAHINAEDVSFEHKAPDQIIVAPNVSQPSVPSTNVGGGGGGGNDERPTRPDPVTVQSVTLINPPTEITTGSSLRFVADVQVTPDKPEYQGVSWSLKEGAPEDCTLTDDGTFFSGTTTGSAIIVARSVQDPSHYDEVALQIVEREPEKPAPVMVNNIEELQQALIEAESGATILLNTGTYDGNLKLTQSVTLKGVDQAETILNGKITASTDEIAHLEISNMTINADNQHLALWQDTHVKSIVMDHITFNHLVSANQATLYFWGTQEDGGYDLISITHSTFNYPNAAQKDQAFVGQTYDADEIIFSNNTINASGPGTIRKGFELSGLAHTFVAEHNVFDKTNNALQLWICDGSDEATFALNHNTITNSLTSGINLDAWTGNTLGKVDAIGNSEAVRITSGSSYQGQFNEVIIKDGTLAGTHTAN